MTRTALIFMALSLGLTACEPQPSGGGTRVEGGELNANRSGDVVTGKMGSAWSNEELHSNAFGAICASDETVTDLVIERAADGSGTFSARCV